MYLPSCH